MSSLHPIEGTITAKPYHTEHSRHPGRLHDPDDRSGTIHGATERSGKIHGPGDRSGTIRGPVAHQGLLEPGSGETTTNALAAELNGLIASLGSYSAQAQSLPLTPPTLPSLPQGSYKPQPTDYAQFTGDAS